LEGVCSSYKGTILKGIFEKKNGPKLPNFEEKKKKEVKAIRFRQPVPARSQKIKGFLKNFYFKIWSIARFGKIFMWMIASLATSQNWKRKENSYPRSPLT